MLAQTGKVGVLRRPAGEVTGGPSDAFAQLVERAVRQTGACEGAGDIVADAAVVRRNRERALCLRDTRLHLAAVHEPGGEECAGERVVRMVPQVLDTRVDGLAQVTLQLIGSAEQLGSRREIGRGAVVSRMALQNRLQEGRCLLRLRPRTGEA